MDRNIRITFNVQALGFPFGKIYKFHIWFSDDIESPSTWTDRNADRIKDELKDVCHVHSIQHTSTMWSPVKKDGSQKNENFNEIILDETIDAKPKDKKNKLETKPITDIRKIDLPNIDDDDLKKLIDKIKEEQFKRKYELSDSEYDFYKENIELISDPKDIKKLCKKYGTDDKFILKKRNVRKFIEEKVSIKNK